MRTIGLLAFATSMLALPLTAAAQPGMTSPSCAQPPPGSPAPQPARVEPKTHLELGLVGASPKGDWNQIDVKTSPGFHLSLGLTVGPNVSIFAGIRYIKVKPGGNDTSF